MIQNGVSFEDALKKAQELTQKALLQKREVEKELERAKLDAKRAVEQAKFDAEQLVSKTRAQAYALIDELEKTKKAEKFTTEDKSRLKKSIKALEDEADPITKAKESDYKLPRKLKVGDNVLIFDIDKKAVVLEEPENGSVLVQAGIIKTRVK